MSNPDTTRIACKQSPYCTDEKCLCEDYFEQEEPTTLKELMSTIERKNNELKELLK